MTKQCIDLLDYAKGFYAKSVQLLEPGKGDDFSIISGSIILTVGMEKLVKGAIYKIHPVMILEGKIEFKDLKACFQGNNFQGRKTISFDEALKRLVELYPNFKKYQHNIQSIIKIRNDLVHNFGDLDIGDLERKIQIKVSDFTEEICEKCLDSTPENILGTDVWSKLQRNCNDYKEANYLDFQERLAHYKALYSEGEQLPYRRIDNFKKDVELFLDCPICNKQAIIAFDIDFDVDADYSDGEIWTDVYPYPEEIILMCNECNFILNNYEELEMLLGDDFDKLCEEAISLFTYTNR